MSGVVRGVGSGHARQRLAARADGHPERRPGDRRPLARILPPKAPAVCPAAGAVSCPAGLNLPVAGTSGEIATERPNRREGDPMWRSMRPRTRMASAGPRSVSWCRNDGRRERGAPRPGRPRCRTRAAGWAYESTHDFCGLLAARPRTLRRPDLPVRVLLHDLARRGTSRGHSHGPRDARHRSVVPRRVHSEAPRSPSTKCSSSWYGRPGIPLNRPANASRMASMPTNRWPCASGPRGASKTASSVKCA